MWRAVKALMKIKSLQNFAGESYSKRHLGIYVDMRVYK